MNDLKPVYMDDFERIRQIIEQARQEATYKVNETIISLYWNIGKFVLEKTLNDGGAFHGQAVVPVVYFI